jgi:hypothetical protein
MIDIAVVAAPMMLLVVVVLALVVGTTHAQTFYVRSDGCYYELFVEAHCYPIY